MRRFVMLGIASAVTLFSPGPAEAFKVDTHVWLADLIIKDLRAGADGKIEIAAAGPRDEIVARLPFGRYPIPPRVRTAILNHPEAFRMGAVGPDALPGIIEGQMVIHPGEGAWGTGEWLDHILRTASTEEEVAFAYGMLAHAAADIWAHSYVNHYAGDVFELRNGEATVESRHILLESYISSKIPWGSSSGIDGAGIALELVKKSGQFVVPEDYLFRTFVTSSDAAAAYPSKTSHMRAIRATYLGLGHLARTNGPTDRIHTMIQKAVVSKLFNYSASDQELNEINKIRQKLHDVLNGGIDKAQEIHGEISAIHREMSAKGFGMSEAAFSQGLQALDRVNELDEKLQTNEQELAALIDKRLRVSEFVEATGPCGSVGGKLLDPAGIGKKIFGKKKKRFCRFLEKNKDRLDLESLITAKNNIKSAISGELRSAGSSAAEALSATHKAMLYKIDAQATLINLSIDLAQRTERNENPIKGTLILWQSDIRKSMAAYSRANLQAIANSMTGGNTLDPLNDWLKCSAPALVGVPSEIPQALCQVRGLKLEITRWLDAVKRIDPLSKELMKLRDEALADVTQLGSDIALDYATDISGVDVKTFANALKTAPTAGAIDDAFASAPANTKLISAAGMSAVFDQDMGLRDGKFQLESFAPVRNAYIMMKLTLLRPKDIGRIFKMRAVNFSNIMTTAAKSIDGDYQWMEESPAYARSDGVPAPAKAPGYGYGHRFAPFAGAEQQAIFRRLFKGPLAPGYLTGPFAAALPQTYRFRPTEECSYPSIAPWDQEPDCAQPAKPFWTTRRH